LREVSADPDQPVGFKLYNRRKPQGLNLAFIDIMSCGLGAIVLVFILVKPDIGVTSTQETGKLHAELEHFSRQEQDITSSIQQLQAQAGEQQQQNRSLDTEIAQLREQVFASKLEIAQKQARLSAVKQSITEKPRIHSSDIIVDDNIGEEEYLIGLTVKGARIGFLVDSSASMTDELLIDIIRRKSGSDQAKKAGPKWNRTKKAVRWLVGRLPKSSRVSVVSYNDNAEFLGGSAWHESNDPAALNGILDELEKLVPSGPTDLHKGLMKIKSLDPKITDLYVITDGLPTTGQSNYSRLNPFSGCFSLLGRSNTISGECREKLFRQTIRETSFRHRVTVNVIMLPLEGDPLASPNYWAWTSATGGLLISPASNWP
jgi:hypothetical protein